MVEINEGTIIGEILTLFSAIKSMTSQELEKYRQFK